MPESKIKITKKELDDLYEVVEQDGEAKVEVKEKKDSFQAEFDEEVEQQDKKVEGEFFGD